MSTPQQVRLDGDILAGFGAPFYGPKAGRDLQDEYFSPRTDFALGWYPERPLLYEHALDAEIADEPIGKVVTTRLTPAGLWVEAQLDRRSKYYDLIRALVQRGALSFSSGARATW